MIYIGSDHAGFEFKQQIIEFLKDKGYKVEDLGPNSSDRVDYPDFAYKVAEKVVNSEKSFGILICGSGIGMSIAANKIKGARAALTNNIVSAKLAKAHNNANIICCGARLIGFDLFKEIFTTYVNTEFEGGRHQNRVDKLNSR